MFASAGQRFATRRTSGLAGKSGMVPWSPSESVSTCGGSITRLLRFHLPIVLLLAPLLAILNGCRRSNDELVEKELGDLPGLRRTHHQRLADELARLEDEAVTPAGLDRALAARTYDSEDNAAACLLDIFTKQQLGSLKSQLAPLLPVRTNEDSQRKQQIIQFASQHLQSIQKIQQATTLPYCRFPIHHARGTLDDLSWIETIGLLTQLMNAEAIRAVEVGDVDQSVEAIAASLRIVQHLANETYLVTRIRAAQLRVDIVAVLLELANHRELTDTHRAQLAELLSVQLAEWPSDAKAWVGERAWGLHFFELARKGYLPSLLTERELQSLSSEENLAEIVSLCCAGLDDDEYGYLMVMRQIIALCEQPYHQRGDALKRLRENLMTPPSEKPVLRLTRHLLLPQLETAQESQARDRAVCEAALWTLRLALGEQPAATTNPLTGTAYRMAVSDGRVEVWGIEHAGSDRIFQLSIPVRTARRTTVRLQD